MTVLAHVHPDAPGTRRRNDYWWVAVLLALLAQTAGLFYWGGRVDANVSALDEARRDHETRLREIEFKTFDLAAPAAPATPRRR